MWRLIRRRRCVYPMKYKHISMMNNSFRPLMIHIEYLIPLLAFWRTITSEIGKYKHDHTVANNIVCAIHSFVYILHYNYNYNMDYAIHASAGYYIYDLFYIFQCIRASSSASSATTHQLQQRAPYIIHHLIGTYLLYDTLVSDNTGPLLHAYYLLEASNIMIYVSYHLHKEYRAYKTVILFAEFIQLLWYSYYRVYMFSSFLYHNQPRFFEFSRMSQCFIIILYTMGVVWTCKLVKRNIGNLSIFYSNNI